MKYFLKLIHPGLLLDSKEFVVLVDRKAEVYHIDYQTFQDACASFDNFTEMGNFTEVAIDDCLLLEAVRHQVTVEGMNILSGDIKILENMGHKKQGDLFDA